MKKLISKDGNKTIYCCFCSGKWRATTRALEKNANIQRSTVRVSETNYDSENDVVLLRDGLEVSYSSLRQSFEGSMFLDKRYYPKEDYADYLGSIFFYMDMSGNVISQVYADVTDSFYEVDSRIIFDDEMYGIWKENLINQIISELKTRSRERQKQLIKENRYEDTEC